MHYSRWHKYGDAEHPVRLRVAGTIEERVWQRVTKTDGCWSWHGSHHEHGYGIISLEGKPRRVHRLVYEMLVGPIPEGLDLDHLCRNRGCCNPAHLEPVTRRENLLRGDTIVAAQVARTHCPLGHEYTPDNTRINNGCRSCRDCERQRDRQRYADGRHLRRKAA